MSGTQSQEQQHVRLAALVDSSETGEIDWPKLAGEGWRWRSQRYPSAFAVIRLDRPVEGLDAISKLVADTQAELAAAGIQSPAVSAHPLLPSGEVDSSGSVAVNLVGSPDLGTIVEAFEAAVTSGTSAGTNSEASSSGGGPPKPPGKEETKPDAKAEAGKTTTPPVLADPAATIAASIPAFPDPQPLWSYIDKADRGPLAKDVVSRLNTSRVDFARRSEWVVAPELVLLDACSSGQREDLAKKMLEVRASLTTSDDETRDAAAKLSTCDAQLAEQRVKFAGEGVALARETLKHMQKWRCIANIGLGVLGVTTLFSMIAVGYLLLYLAPNDDVSDAVIPIIIFVLALFAISPAVLLLRERPLEGLDKWSPTGASSDSTTTEPGASTSTAAAAEAPKAS